MVRHHDDLCGGCSKPCRPRGVDGKLLIVAGVVMVALTAAVVAVLTWSGWAFMAPISQANVHRTTK